MFDSEYCPKCGRVDTDIGGCGTIVSPCPDPVRIDPNKVMVARCGPCGKTLAIPVDKLIRGKAKEFGSGDCTLAVCAAEIVQFPDPVKEGQIDGMAREIARLSSELTSTREDLRGWKESAEEAIPDAAARIQELTSTANEQAEVILQQSNEIASLVGRLDRGAPGPGPAAKKSHHKKPAPPQEGGEGGADLTKFPGSE